MSTFLERLVLEQSELQEKLDKLTDYIKNNKHFETLSEENKTLLKEQRTHMHQYNLVLKDRIRINS